MYVDINVLIRLCIVNGIKRSDNIKGGLDFLLDILIFAVIGIRIFLVYLNVIFGAVTLKMTVVITVIFAVIKIILIVSVSVKSRKLCGIRQ